MPNGDKIIEKLLTSVNELTSSLKVRNRGRYMSRKVRIPRHRLRHPREDPRRHVRHARFPMAS